ncbi:hypothetical protein EMMF5_006168 [Cystobasidiomycetes sp. EMM_F5]
MRGGKRHALTDTSTAFQQGLSSPLVVPPVLVISDARGSNDTLANSNCPAWRPLNAEWDWAKRFTPPIAARLESFFTMSANIRFSPFDIVTLFWLCAFESAAKQTTSEFCYLFQEDEILQFEYFLDLEKFYNRGYGHELGPLQGAGWINELVARLTESPVKDATQVNMTLDSDEKSFPLRAGVYADFSHDNT